ncbi:MAG: 50S ribosomal protein L15 [Omnitrophica bacterium RIFCSPHIGHO2_02_FULL_46_11]|nr:MAG: 50S ribosomal protein L15 [Omnitrophica bacterium RIFCSPLOWO2_01_FULL_45_10b]OGW86522.1 MAG: 50S ribosomal protein L15 [Omnitrophica bacterium RIFCSPHIGHO2_02_FULL_46_11]
MRSKVPYQKKPKRLGRGESSGHGKTSTKGHKGQRARSGFHQRPAFEGGQTPMHQRFPKRGFHQPNHKEYAIVNLDQLDQLKVSEVSPDWLLQNKVIKRLEAGLKVLGRGKLTHKLKVQAHRFSAQAKEAIEKAGGEALLIEKK